MGSGTMRSGESRLVSCGTIYNSYINNQDNVENI